MRVSGGWLDHADTQAVCAMLTGAGHSALFVGGCVRNALMGIAVSDLDIATDARPEAVMTLAEAAGLRAVPTGIAHGTVTVVAGGIPHEITTFRRDVETDGRRAVVAFADDPRTDALRRDFTMNALYAAPDGQVIDPLGGLPDLMARRVRFIGDAGERIREDYLRILRFFRFTAHYGDPAHGACAETLAVIAAHLGGIDRLADERITAEFEKLLAAPDPLATLGQMQAVGVLERILPGAHVPSLAMYRHLAAEHGRAPTLAAQIAALRAPVGDHRLRWPNAVQTGWEMQRDLAETGTDPAENAWRHGADIAWDAALLRAALLGQPPGAMAHRIALGTAARFPVTAADLMPAYQGKALGERLRALEARWIASDFTLDRAALLG